MRAVYSDVDQAMSRAIKLKQQGHLDTAIKVFRQEIEDRFDAEFENLLEATRRDEMEGVLRAEGTAQRLWRWLGGLVAVVAVGTVCLCGVAARHLERSLTRPISLLSQGAEAFGKGDLEHRIEFQDHSELGKLANDFNRMASRQQDQRDRLLAAQSDLEQKVAFRTAEVATVNKRLLELDRSRVQFLADISHELRTPLTALRGEAEITLRGGAKPDTIYRDALERIVSQALEMGRLVDDLTFLSRSETDTIRMEPVCTDLIAIIFEGIRDGEILARNKAIQIDANFSKTPVSVLADPMRLKQVVVILLDNAIKYSPAKSTVKFSLNVEREDVVLSKIKDLVFPKLRFRECLIAFIEGRAPKGGKLLVQALDCRSRNGSSRNTAAA